MNGHAGKYLMMGGLFLFLVGILLYLFPGRWHWIGRLPGDIRIEREHFRFYFPITTLILFSLALSLLVNLIKKFL